MQALRARSGTSGQQQSGAGRVAILQIRVASPDQPLLSTKVLLLELTHPGSGVQLVGATLDVWLLDESVNYATR